MLKIREDFNLKELEKYGFVDEIGFLQKDTNCITYYINKDTRIIEFLTDDCGGEVVSDDTLYDLIKADIVVKE